MSDTARLTEQRMIELATSGVHKLDLLGARGADRVTTDELNAMACLLVISGLLPAFADRKILPRKIALGA